MIKCLFIIAFLLVSFFVKGEEGEVKANYKYSFKAGYYGNNGHNPGLVVGADYVLWEKEKYKRKLFKPQEKVFQGRKQWLADIDAGFFVDKQTFLGSFVTGGLVYRRIDRNQRNYHFGISPLGYFHAAFPETYKVDETGKVNRVFLPGRNYYTTTFTWGIGREMKRKKLDAWYLDLDLMILSQYNTSVLPLLSLEFGYRFDLDLEK